MNAALVAVVVLVIAAGIAWDGFCLHDLFKADPTTVRFLPKWAWAAVCLVWCPWGGLLYILVGRNAFDRAS